MINGTPPPQVKRRESTSTKHKSNTKQNSEDRSRLSGWHKIIGMHVPTPAPKVEAATAEAVKPKAAPLAEQPVASSATNAETVSASFVCAEPPPNASLTTKL